MNIGHIDVDGAQFPEPCFDAAGRVSQIALNVDCMEYMQALPDKVFDLAIVDPPYFSGPERRGYYGRRISPIGVRRDYSISPKWDVPGKDYFSEMERVAKRYIVWGCNYF